MAAESLPDTFPPADADDDDPSFVFALLVFGLVWK